MTAQHTPLSLAAAFREYGLLTNDGRIAVMRPDPDFGEVLALEVLPFIKPKRGEGHKLVDPERDAFANFIVRACNNHDGLVAALEEIVANYPYRQSSANIIARAAIAKAKGE